MGIKKIDVEKVATAIEADAGEALPDLRQALAEAKAGLGRVTTPEQMLVRRAREKSGLRITRDVEWDIGLTPEEQPGKRRKGAE